MEERYLKVVGRKLIPRFGSRWTESGNFVDGNFSDDGLLLFKYEGR